MEALLTSIATELTTNVNSALPIVGPVVALIAGIFVGWKIFKSLTGAKTA